MQINPEQLKAAQRLWRDGGKGWARRQRGERKCRGEEYVHYLDYDKVMVSRVSKMTYFIHMQLTVFFVHPNKVVQKCYNEKLYQTNNKLNCILLIYSNTLKVYKMTMQHASL